MFIAKVQYNISWRKNINVVYSCRARAWKYEGHSVANKCSQFARISTAMQTGPNSFNLPIHCWYAATVSYVFGALFYGLLWILFQTASPPSQSSQDQIYKKMSMMSCKVSSKFISQVLSGRWPGEAVLLVFFSSSSTLDQNQMSSWTTATTTIANDVISHYSLFGQISAPFYRFEER